MDPYAGAMKGAILSVCPEATLVDLAHEVPPHDVLAGALTLDAACRTFPPGTVFVAVVDPGVGSPRRGLALQAGPHLFVGPDNGLFSFVLREHAELRVHGLENARLFRSPVSPVFHGRDVFGPVATLGAGRGPGGGGAEGGAPGPPGDAGAAEARDGRMGSRGPVPRPLRQPHHEPLGARGRRGTGGRGLRGRRDHP